MAVLGTRGWLSNDSCVTLSTSWLFGPLCRKCRQTPILIIPLSPHCFHFLQSALNDRAGGARLAFERLGCRSRRELAVSVLCKKCRQTPIFILPVSPPFFFHPPEARIRGPQEPCWACMTGLRTARVPVSAHAGVFDPVQKVSANPYFNHTIPLSPHFFHFSHSALRGRAGTRDWPSDGAGARLGARWLFRPLCRKCRQPAILILLVSPHLFHSAAGAQWGRAGVGEGGSSDAERSKRSGNGRVERGRAPKYPTNPVAVLETHAPRAGRVWGAARCASRGQG